MKEALVSGVMEAIEVRQLVQGIPFATTVLARSPVAWSEENNISLVTQHGVYIMEVTPSPEECTPALMFTRYFVPAPDAESSTANPDIDLRSVLETVDHIRGHTFMMDATLSANKRAMVEQDPHNRRSNATCMPGGEALHRGYQQGAWSPLGLGQYGRSVLALLTSNFRITLMGRVNRYWAELADLSQQWHQYCSYQNWERAKVPAHTPIDEQFEARMKMLAICRLVWTSPIGGDGKNCCLLIGLSERGDAVFWRVSAACTSIQQVHLLCVHDTKMVMIKSAHWHTTGHGSGYLTLGNGPGQVKILHCEFSDKHVQMKDLGYAWESEDRMIIGQTELCPLGQDQYLLLTAKSNTLVASSLSLSPNKVTVNHFSHTWVGDLEISGFLVFGDMNVYVSVKDGFIKHYKIKLLSDGSASIEDMGTLFHSEEVTYSGFVASPNRAMVCVFEAIKVAYDHLIEREPTQVNIYRVVDTPRMMERLLDSPKPLHLNADLFESLRISVLKAGQTSFDVLHTDEILDQPLQTLKTHFWLVKIARSVASTNEALLETLNNIEVKLQETILMKWMIDILKKFCKRKEPFTPSLAHSLSLMCEWVKKAGKQAVKSLNEVQPLIKRLEKSKREQCPVCQAAVQLKSLTHGRCSNGHTLPRCCLTLMLTEPAIQCSRCRVYAHADAKDVVGEGDYRCTYCSGSMVSDLCRRTQ
ncbi:uncharacterized protein LOC127000350 isoform X2 [Eriocheir sinensis]|uniref:uncharacterized protein LOC127000350 isoform X2 n=1 Tax=Eriocheir sinensis TaxID=95602 RepID=UPI0021C92356|nr:uncharacterized protein LOC127000350 isoform X2 [Eriocheir sinensis]